MSSNKREDDANTQGDLTSLVAVTKCREAGEVLNQAIKHVVEGCVAGANTYDLSVSGDKKIVELLSNIYEKRVKGEKIRKGVAFPTCVTLNAKCGNHSPTSLETGEILNTGDVVKISAGAHIDGYICVGGHTVCVGATEPIGGPAGRAMMACRVAIDVVLRTITAGISSGKVAEVINQVVKDFSCNTVVGVYCHNIKRHVIAGSKRMFLRETPETKMEDFTFNEGEVYAIDILVSTGEGKPREADQKTTVYRRLVENTYILKTTLGRSFMAEVNKKFPTLPFNIRNIEDHRAALVGLGEACRHSLLQPYPVMTEKEEDIVAHLKFTLMMLPSGPRQISCHNLTEQPISADIQVKDEAIKEILQKPLVTSNKQAQKNREAEAENS